MTSYRNFARDALKQHLKDGEYHDDEVERFLARLFYVAVDARSDKGWDELKALLDEGPDRVRAFYLAVGPSLFGDISDTDPRARADHRRNPDRGGKADRPGPRIGQGAERHASARCSAKTRSSASTIISARRRCRT
jgi:hypothetical protein